MIGNGSMSTLLDLKSTIDAGHPLFSQAVLHDTHLKGLASAQGRNESQMSQAAYHRPLVPLADRSRWYHQSSRSQPTSRMRLHRKPTIKDLRGLTHRETILVLVSMAKMGYRLSSTLRLQGIRCLKKASCQMWKDSPPIGLTALLVQDSTMLEPLTRQLRCPSLGVRACRSDHSLFHFRRDWTM